MDYDQKGQPAPNSGELTSSAPIGASKGSLANAAVTASAHRAAAVGEALQVSTEQITDIARDMIAEVAPHELAMFDTVVGAWRADDRRRRRKRVPGTSVGFGIEAFLLSELVLPIITATLAEILGSAVVGRMHHRRRKTPTVAPPAEPVRSADREGDGGGGGCTKMTEQHAHAVHDACQRHAIVVGLPPERAALLADAFVGALASRGLL